MTAKPFIGGSAALSDGQRSTARLTHELPQRQFELIERSTFVRNICDDVPEHFEERRLGLIGCFASSRQSRRLHSRHDESPVLVFTCRHPVESDVGSERAASYQAAVRVVELRFWFGGHFQNDSAAVGSEGAQP